MSTENTSIDNPLNKYPEILQSNDPYCLGIGMIVSFALPKYPSPIKLEESLSIMRLVANLSISAKILLPYFYSASFQYSYRELSKS